LRFILGVVFGGLITFLVLTSPSGNPSDNAMYIGGATFGGFFLPHLMLTSRVTNRQNEVRKAMPDALDLLTICVEAGLGFDAAMSKVSEKWDNQLSLAFARTIREIQLGKTRREALRDMSERLGVDEMTSFVAAIIQSEQLGVSMAKILRIQSDQMRVKRRQRAEELAHQAPVKMVIPMAFLMFPTIMIIILTPAAIQIMNSL
jgi:tight adherence protein C